MVVHEFLSAGHGLDQLSHVGLSDVVENGNIVIIGKNDHQLECDQPGEFHNWYD